MKSKEKEKILTIETALKERIKELECLYSISKIFNQTSDEQVEDIFGKVISILPNGYQFPENTYARIVFDKKEYKSKSLKAPLHKQSADIIINDKKRGVIEIICSCPSGETDKYPFLKEEQNLLDTVAKELSNTIDKIEQKEEKKKIQEQLMHADRLATLGSLAAGIAHELNEPLGSILGFAQLVNSNKNLPKEAKDDINKIINASLHSREVIRKLLFFSKQEKQKKTSININGLIRNGYYFLEALCSKEAIKIQKILDPKIPRIIIDPVHLNQIIVNIFVNAIQAMPKGGKLTIKTQFRDNTIFLFIHDTGIGMSNETMNRIFEPFFTTKEEMNTGLGLAVVHNIIKLYNGAINVKSELGKGSTFEIIFPVIQTKNHSHEES